MQQKISRLLKESGDVFQLNFSAGMRIAIIATATMDAKAAQTTIIFFTANYSA